MGTQCTTLRHPFQYNQRDREKKRKEVRPNPESIASGSMMRLHPFGAMKVAP
jgi:hypothetical protein